MLVYERVYITIPTFIEIQTAITLYDTEIFKQLWKLVINFLDSRDFKCHNALAFGFISTTHLKNASHLFLP